MSAEFTPLLQNELPQVDQAQGFAAMARSRIGRAAAATLLVVSGGVATFAAETAVHPQIAYADTIDDALASYPDKGDGCAPADTISPAQTPTAVSPYASCRYYDWGVPTSSGGFSLNSSRGYGYRNCTDWAAFRVGQASDGKVTLSSSLGDAKNWYDNSPASEQSTTPKAGDVAVSTSGHYGHVAFVESVDTANAKMTISEYNYDEDGHGDQRTLSTSGSEFTEYVDLGIDMGSSSSTPLPTDNTVLRMINREQPDGVNATYWAKGTDSFESWYRADGTGVHTTELVNIPQGDIKDIDEQDNADGEHLLYTQTTHDIYETYWYPGQGIHTARIIHDDANIRKIEKTVGPDGSQELYAMTDTGVDEYWWNPGGDGIHKNRIYTLANPVAMEKEVEPDGTQELYVADRSYVYENWWKDGVLHTGGQIMNIAQGDINSLDFSEDSDGTHRIYVGRDHDGVWEASWKPGGNGISTWQVTGDQGVRAIRKYNDNGTPVLYVATEGGVFEYWWPAGTHDVHGGTITQQPDIHDIERTTTPSGAQAVDTATGTHITESYWFPGGDGIHTGTIE